MHSSSSRSQSSPSPFVHQGPRPRGGVSLHNRRTGHSRSRSPRRGIPRPRDAHSNSVTLDSHRHQRHSSTHAETESSASPNGSPEESDYNSSDIPYLQGKKSIPLKARSCDEGTLPRTA